MIGIMKTDVHLSSTSLKLQKNQRVKLSPAANLLLLEGRFFARPADGKWSDGIDHDKHDSILLRSSDFTLEDKLA